MAELSKVGQHFDQEEQPFVAKALDWIERASQDYTLCLTPFLNPRERHIVSILLGDREDVKVSASGIFARAEKERLVIAPSFMEIGEADYEMVLLQVTFAKKFVTLRHKDLLGALLSAGLERTVFGDIVTDDNKGLAQVAIDKRQVPYVMSQIDSIGKVKADWTEVPFDDALIKEVEGKEEFLLLSSLRLDTVVATAFNLSRQEAKDLILSGFVAVNWASSDRLDRIIRSKDVISVRKKGRISLQSLAGHSKRDKIKAVFQIIHR
ncbi:hypothetical protein G6R29_02190 [Fructobacillus sp. M2-14]|uniref:RNA-binding S4 domain-containing protein n=1 Tax=Fructobacillus broussonetiae TaxID=2713173 RepID=A0ABS5R0B6_9LACO|nr:YlmH/Sll1252 family protein [Fructobacillus broussonetiae]MBS9338447.1 hypothetical protein [Fructobacillus broussonetiae]